MSSFSLRPLNETNLADCAALLAGSEYSCASLMSRFVRRGRIMLPEETDGGFWTVYKQIPGKNAQTICAVIAAERGGLVLHCISPDLVCGADEGENFCALVAPVLERLVPDCIMGGELGTRLLESACRRSTRVEWRYDLMEFQSRSESSQKEQSKEENLVPFIPAKSEGAFAVILNKNYHLRRCLSDDAKILYPLQKAYEQEEVLPPGDAHSELVCMANLRRNLEKQQIFAVFDTDGKTPLAKAGTNAQGFAWSQIGGVYTVPAARGQGLARFLVRFLANKLAIEGKRAVLFVKKTNEPARRSYFHAGFMATGSFKITYF